MTDNFVPPEDDRVTPPDISDVPAYVPPPLPAYQRHQSGSQILTGFLVGSAISVIAYVLLGSFGGGGFAVFILPVKFIASIILLCTPRQRGYGVGLLMSIAVGVLLFFVTCFANFKTMH